MKKSKRNEALTQGILPAAQALSDDDLMDVTGGTVFWRWRTTKNGDRYKDYGALCGGVVLWFGDDVYAARSWAGDYGGTARLVEVDDVRAGEG